MLWFVSENPISPKIAHPDRKLLEQHVRYRERHGKWAPYVIIENEFHVEHTKEI